MPVLHKKQQGRALTRFALMAVALLLLSIELQGLEAFPQQRFTRSCGNQVYHLISKACSGHHKRSPHLVRFVLDQYYESSHKLRSGPSGMSPSSSQDTGAAVPLQAPQILDPLFSPWVLEHGDTQEWANNNYPNMEDYPFPTGSPGSRRRALLVPIMEKCCSSSGCSEADVFSYC